MDDRDTVCGLSRAELLPVLAQIAGEPVASLTLESAPVGGGHRIEDKQFCTFRYATGSGRSGEATLFVKRCLWKGRSESVHYRYLASHGVPVPRLYAALVNRRGEEVVFLEKLPRISFRAESEAEWRAMLSLLAKLNACEITTEYEPNLHPFEQVGRVEGMFWISGLQAFLPRPEIEESLRACGVQQPDLPALLASAERHFAEVSAQPQGLLHQDFMPDNIGWTADGREMAVFDLHKNGRGPRFADVAPYLGQPDWSAAAPFLDSPGESGVSRRESLSRHYLDEYARHGGSRVSLADFRQETAALSKAHKLSVLSWLAEVRADSRIQETLAFLR